MKAAAMTAKVAVKRACKVCRTEYVKRSMGHVACSPVCAQEVSRLKREKSEAKALRIDRAETKVKLLALKGLSYWEGRAQHVVNKFIRQRDEGNGCISCGITYSTVWQAGHYIAVGANSTLRYVEDNIHLQCVQCNMNKGGNATEYRLRLIAKIGTARVEALEAWHSPVKSTVEACQSIEATYKAKLRELLANRENLNGSRPKY